MLNTSQSFVSIPNQVFLTEDLTFKLFIRVVFRPASCVVPGRGSCLESHALCGQHDVSRQPREAA